MAERHFTFTPQASGETILASDINELQDAIATIDATGTDASSYVRLTGSKTHDWPAVGQLGSSSTTVTVPGAVLGQSARAFMNVAIGANIMTAHVSAADTVTVYVTNTVAGAVDIPSGTLTVIVEGV